MYMAQFGPLDGILFLQLILFLVLWSIDNKDFGTLETINGIAFVVLFFVNWFLKANRRRKDA
jgi:NADH:ubiquinone oxidoreductase subunit 3 (subunit A)